MSAPTIGDAAVGDERSAEAALEGAEERTSYERRFIPQTIRASYSQKPGEPWTWSVMIEGPQVRKDGSVGTRSINQWWSKGWLDRPLDAGYVPGWALAFVVQHHPAPDEL